MYIYVVAIGFPAALRGTFPRGSRYCTGTIHEATGTAHILYVLMVAVYFILREYWKGGNEERHRRLEVVTLLTALCYCVGGSYIIQGLVRVNSRIFPESRLINRSKVTNEECTMAKAP